MNDLWVITLGIGIAAILLDRLWDPCTPKCRHDHSRGGGSLSRSNVVKAKWSDDEYKNW